MLAQIFCSALTALGQELAAWKPSRDRALFGASPVMGLIGGTAVYRGNRSRAASARVDQSHGPICADAARRGRGGNHFLRGGIGGF
jgi:hypothetical protein